MKTMKRSPLAEQLLPDEMWPESSSLENDDSESPLWKSGC